MNLKQCDKIHYIVENMKLQKWVFGALLLTILSSMLLYPTFDENINIDQIREGVGKLGIWAPLAFVVFYIIGTIFIPSTPFIALAGVLFGFKHGFLYVTTASFIGAIVTFYISRTLGRNWAESILQHKYFGLAYRYNKRLETGAIWDLIVLRLAPMPFNVLNILMGISRISIGDYVIGTLLGLIPSNVLVVYFGNLITKLF